MRNPKKLKAKKAGSSSGSKKPAPMEEDVPAAPTVWRPGVDPMAEDEELDYDRTAYDCLHRFQLDWPCLSFELLRDDLGGPRSAFPHTAFLAAGTQADAAKHNYIAIMKLAKLGQGRHGKNAPDSEDEEESEEGASGDEMEQETAPGEEPAQMHYRMVANTGGVNRLRSMPQRPGLLAVWCDTAQVRLVDTSALLQELASEEAPRSKPSARVQLAPLAQHSHSTEGFAVDWSPAKAGRLASGDCRSCIHVWEPQEGGKWQVSGAFKGHEGSVEDLQWSPSEETVFASCSVDGSVRVWDTRERARPMLTAKAHDCDVNVISWNKLVTYMLASGADDGALRIWDLRSLGPEGAQHVSHFSYHKAHVTSVEWSPYEGSMLLSSAGDNQVAVWDLALERDAEEEEALAPEGNAVAQEELPPQLLFVHAGQRDVKEVHWHSQIPGMIGSTAADCFNLFKPANV